MDALTTSLVSRAVLGATECAIAELALVSLLLLLLDTAVGGLAGRGGRRDGLRLRLCGGDGGHGGVRGGVSIDGASTGPVMVALILDGEGGRLLHCGHVLVVMVAMARDWTLAGPEFAVGAAASDFAALLV